MAKVKFKNYPFDYLFRPSNFNNRSNRNKNSKSLDTLNNFNTPV